MSAPQRIVRLASELAQASSPGAALRRVTALRRELDAFERQLVSRALAEGATFASIARELGLTRQAVHRRFRHLMPAGTTLVATTEARRVLLYAREEALASGVTAPSGEHVIVGALRAADEPAAAILRDAGATLERARVQVQATATRQRTFQRAAAADDFRPLLRAPARYARELGDGRIEVEHLLLGALEDDAGPAARVLRALGADVDAVRDSLTASVESRLA